MLEIVRKLAFILFGVLTKSYLRRPPTTSPCHADPDEIQAKLPAASEEPLAQHRPATSQGAAPPQEAAPPTSRRTYKHWTPHSSRRPSRRTAPSQVSSSPPASLRPFQVAGYTHAEVAEYRELLDEDWVARKAAREAAELDALDDGFIMAPRDISEEVRESLRRKGYEEILQGDSITFVPEDDEDGDRAAPDADKSTYASDHAAAQYFEDLAADRAEQEMLPDTEDFGDGYFRFLEQLTAVQRDKAVECAEPITLTDGSEGWRWKGLGDA